MVSNDRLRDSSQSDPRDRLWEATFETYYDAYYEEILASDLIDRWQIVDDAAKVMVALTASGSAVSGWALWSQPGFRWLWAVVAGGGAVVAILHATLGVAARIKDWSDIAGIFTTLRTDLETFRYRMEIGPDFSVEKFTSAFEGFRKRFSEAAPRLKNDILLTRGLQNRAQDKLNERLRDKITT
jgi:hypothetical protein